MNDIEKIKKISSISYDFIKNSNLKTIPTGRYNLGGGVYVNIESYTTKNRQNARYESHENYRDIQFIISGSEIIFLEPICNLQEQTPYNKESDIVFYEDSADGIDIVLNASDFLIINPGMGHMPCVCTGDPGIVKKAVFKIPYFAAKNKGLYNGPKHKHVKYLFIDVDGTLTDGKIYMGQSGEVMKAFDIKDGFGIRNIAIPAGITSVICTGRESDIVLNRCKELGIDHIFQGVADKKKKIIEIIKDTSQEFLAYIGDDINDLDCMKMIKNVGGLVGCPADAAKEVCDIADFVAPHNGGNGAVRDFIEWLTGL